MVVEERRNILYFIKASEGCWITQKGSVSLSARQFAKEVCVTTPEMVEEFGEITDEEYQACQAIIRENMTEEEILAEEVDENEVVEYIKSILGK